VGKSVSAFGVVVLPGDLGLGTVAAGDDEVRSGQVGIAVHDAYFATDPLNPDTDGDGLLDGVERALGANPNDPSDADDFRDNDYDGLVNAQERDGWPLFKDELRVTVDNEVLSFCKAALIPPFKVCDQASKMPNDECTTDADCTDCTAAGDCTAASFPNGRCVDRLVFIFDRQNPPADCEVVPVTSDPFEPDTDFDGLPDLLESILRTNPRLRDTDGDGLLDFDEFDPESPFSIDFATFRDFEDLCYDADQCFYDPAGSRLFGTDLAVPDTDGDGRTDPLELFRGWTVSPFGKLPYVVMSSPVDADADRDGANDLQEHANATDPGNADTDGDGALDGSDANPTGFGKGIFVRLESWNVGDDDCDKGTGEQYGDFDYVFEVNRILPDGTIVNEYHKAAFVQLGTYENEPTRDVLLELAINDTTQLTLNSGEILELKVDIDEKKNPGSAEADPTVTWLGKEQYNYSSVATGEVVMSADSGCFGDDKVRWFISVGN